MVECADKKAKKKFKLVWKENMTNRGEPEVEIYNKGADYVKVSFIPDYTRFGMPEGLDDAHYKIFKKRIYDLCGVIDEKVKVTLDGEKIKLNNFSDYANMYLGPGAIEMKDKQSKKNKAIKEDSLSQMDMDLNAENDAPDKEVYKVVYKKERWEVIVAQSENGYQQVSFVNGICTGRGGAHVDYISQQICKTLIEDLEKKNKKLKLKPQHIKNYLWIFLNCTIENPQFDSQTKERMTLKASSFGSKCELDEKFFKRLYKTEIHEIITFAAKVKEEAQMAKKMKGKRTRLTGVAKLEDANMAGKKDAESCVLILTEGDSAKTLAMSGMEIIGRDNYGVFPLRGKFLNVRDAVTKQIMENAEVIALIKIIGLQMGKVYEDKKTLRYGSVMIMADQDHDGSHIKGLVINFFHKFWPSLVRSNTFLREFITPIIKATKGNEVIPFYALPDFDKWAEAQGDAVKRWKIKYYKGLGTSTDKEAKEYFRDFVKHKINFKYVNHEDDEAIDKVFNKKKADLRKEWLAETDPEITVDHNEKTLTYKDFVNKELVHFSIADCKRSISSVCDGFKPGQRKILFSCFKRKLTKEIKVAQLSGYVSEHSAYHHGEASLQGTIVNLAQNFVGSNNINLLEPVGQFGSRNMGGKDHASARYIFTNLAVLTRYIFKEEDDHLYKYLDDDGLIVEPEWYLPIIPMILVNGSDGIGTGWSTNIPQYNPREICEAIRNKLLTGADFEVLSPWYKGWDGEMIAKENMTKFEVKGTFELDVADDTLRITELPVKKWTRDFKDKLEKLLDGDNAKLEDMLEYHTTRKVDFKLKLREGLAEKYQDNNTIENDFKLKGSITCTNMVAFDQNGNIKRYNSVVEIMQEFFDLRLTYYTLRKEYLISVLERDRMLQSEKKRFIIYVIETKIKINNIKKKKIIEQLVEHQFVKMCDMPKIKSSKENSLKKIQQDEQAEKGSDESEEEEEKEGKKPKNIGSKSEDASAKDYDYLQTMQIYSLSLEKVDKIKGQLAEKEVELTKMNDYAEKEMWIDDLTLFQVKLIK